jgi:hypothetical protein
MQAQNVNGEPFPESPRGILPLGFGSGGNLSPRGVNGEKFIPVGFHGGGFGILPPVPVPRGDPSTSEQGPIGNSPPYSRPIHAFLYNTSKTLAKFLPLPSYPPSATQTSAPHSLTRDPAITNSRSRGVTETRTRGLGLGTGSSHAGAACLSLTL